MAPTVGYATSWGAQTWQEHVRVVGKAVGKEEQAEKLIKDTEGGIAKVKADHPGLRGKTYSLSIGNTPARPPSDCSWCCRWSCSPRVG
ncbi:hypothetical protein ACWY4P_06280 [Streptomyces sp. LZ34]